MSEGNGKSLLTAKDFTSDQEVRWCPGCGDYAILSAVQKFLPELGLPRERVPLRRRVERFPYVPHDAARRDERCFETYNIQVSALEQRLRATGIKKLVIGVSGGLNSTQALIVAAKTMDMERMQGAAAIQLLQAASSGAGKAGDAMVAAATGLGGNLDMYG